MIKIKKLQFILLIFFIACNKIDLPFNVVSGKQFALINDGPQKISYIDNTGGYVDTDAYDRHIIKNMDLVKKKCNYARIVIVMPNKPISITKWAYPWEYTTYCNDLAIKIDMNGGTREVNYLIDSWKDFYMVHNYELEKKELPFLYFYPHKDKVGKLNRTKLRLEGGKYNRIILNLEGKFVKMLNKFEAKSFLAKHPNTVILNELSYYDFNKKD